MGRFRDALDDVNVRVSEQTLLEVGRYFQAPTLRYRSSQAVSHDSGRRNAHGHRGTAIDGAPVEMSYIPLMDTVFGRRRVREPTSGALPDGEDAADDPQRDSARNPGHNPRRETDQPGGRPSPSIGKGRNEGADDNDRCYVNVDRIRAARVAVIETPDALGRSPLFSAAAAGGVPAVKTLIRHGAASSLAVEGTGLTPYSVAPSSLMKRVLAAEARHSLYQAISSKRGNGHRLAGGAKDDGSVEQEAAGHKLAAAAASLDHPAKTLETRRMETWVSTLAEGEQAEAIAGETRVDQKTSLHLAAAAGLPEAVKDLIGRGMAELKDAEQRTAAAKASAGGASPALPPWKTSRKPPEHGRGEPRLNTAHRALDHQTFPRGLPDAAARTADANGWSALHACCNEASPQHYSCALALLGSQMDPNARSNTGRTPLHVAAGASSSAKVRGGVTFVFATYLHTSN